MKRKAGKNFVSWVTKRYQMLKKLLKEDEDNIQGAKQDENMFLTIRKLRQELTDEKYKLKKHEEKSGDFQRRIRGMDEGLLSG